MCAWSLPDNRLQRTVLRAAAEPEGFPDMTPARRALSLRPPTRFALHQCQPNPFGRATTFVRELVQVYAYSQPSRTARS